MIVFLALVSFFGYFYFSINEKETKLVFCDVGQGDAAYIRVKNRIDVLIDAGPDRKVLNCLGKYMPFWDRKIELAIVSHPQKDHFGGFLYLLDRYQIEKMLMTPLDNQSQSFKQLKEKIAKKKVKVDFPFAGEKINILTDVIEFYWPTEEFIVQNLFWEKSQFKDGRLLDKSVVLGTSTLDDNNFSLVFLFEEASFKALFTGDATPTVLDNLIDSRWRLTRKAMRTGNNKKDNVNAGKITLLKIPHHGSKNGLTKKFLELANPTVAVISVGKKNPYGHPAEEVLELLQAYKVKIRRTDKEGNIVFRLR